MDSTNSLSTPFIPPAPEVYAKDPGFWKLRRDIVRSNISIWPQRSFEIMFDPSRARGITTPLVNDPEGIRQVLVCNAANYRRPISVERLVAPLGGEGLFHAKGGTWKRQRRTLAPTFTPNGIDLLVPHFQQAALQLMQSLDGHSHANLSDRFQDTAVEAVFRALFSLPESAARASLRKLVRDYVGGPGVPTILDHFATRLDSFGFALRKRRKVTHRWFAAIDAIIAARRAEPVRAGQHDLLDVLMNLRDTESGASLADGEIRDQCGTMVFAGTETTARTMFWAAYLLTRDPGEQARVHAELAAFPPDRATTLADLQNWPRLRNVMLEAMRLYPPVPLLLRDAIGDDELCGEHIAKNTRVWISPWVLHRHRKFWELPTAFMPDRFAGSPAPWTQMPAYLPFGAGPRICIGLSFAMAEAQIVLAHLLLRYRLDLADTRPVIPIGQITVMPSHEPNFALEKRQQPTLGRQKSGARHKLKQTNEGPGDAATLR